MALTKLGMTRVGESMLPVYLLCGNATRDADAPPAGSKRPAKVSVAGINHENGDTTYINVNGWRDRAADVMAVRKGDSILVIGTMKEREYNGKKYFDLDADFICRSGVDGYMVSGDYPVDYGVTAPQMDFADLSAEDGDGELPF